MKTLYRLNFRTWSNGDEEHNYAIGVFSTREEAEETAQRYLREVKGFCDYACVYEILEYPLIGKRTSTDRVWTYEGWDETENVYETNILDGPFFTSRAAAREAMRAAKAENQRNRWLVLDWTIGQCEWTEGFIRDYDNGELVPTLAELRAKLREYIQPRTMCGVEFEYRDHVMYGFPLAVGEQLFLLAEDDDFLLSGFTVRRLRDIYELGDRKGIYQTIAEKEGLTDFPAPDVDVTDWRAVFSSLQKLDKHIIIEREYEPDFFRLGVIEQVGQDHVLFRHYDADGIWQEPARILYRDITSVTFDDRYANIFSKYI